MHGSVVGTKSVLELLVVNSDLDRDSGIDQTNKGGWSEQSEIISMASGGTQLDV